MPKNTEQADKIREFDTMFHPLAQAGLRLLITGMDPATAKLARKYHEWAYKLIQTPTLLEQVLEILPFTDDLDPADPQEPKKGG